MTVDANAGNNDATPVDAGSQAEGHPAWQEILDVIPSDLQGLVKPTLEKWDKGVQDKIQALHTQYDPYKEFATEGVDAESINQALWLVQELQQNPNKVVADAIDAFGLDFVTKELAATGEIPSGTPAPEPYSEDVAGADITKHPEFIALRKSLEGLTGTIEEQKAAQQAEEDANAFEKQLDDLQEVHKEEGEFNKIFVTALMSNGLDGETAVKQYFDTVNQAAAKIAGTSTSSVPTAPIVMGGNGSTGSGIPSAPVSLGQMKSADVKNLVLDYINASRQS